MSAVTAGGSHPTPRSTRATLGQKIRRIFRRGRKAAVEVVTDLAEPAMQVGMAAAEGWCPPAKVVIAGAIELLKAIKVGLDVTLKTIWDADEVICRPETRTTRT